MYYYKAQSCGETLFPHIHSIMIYNSNPQLLLFLHFDPLFLRFSYQVRIKKILATQYDLFKKKSS